MPQGAHHAGPEDGREEPAQDGEEDCGLVQFEQQRQHARSERASTGFVGDRVAEAAREGRAAWHIDQVGLRQRTTGTEHAVGTEPPRPRLRVEQPDDVGSRPDRYVAGREQPQQALDVVVGAGPLHVQGRELLDEVPLREPRRLGEADPADHPAPLGDHIADEQLAVIEHDPLRCADQERGDRKSVPLPDDDVVAGPVVADPALECRLRSVPRLVELGPRGGTGEPLADPALGHPVLGGDQTDVVVLLGGVPPSERRQHGCEGGLELLRACLGRDAVEQLVDVPAGVGHHLAQRGAARLLDELVEVDLLSSIWSRERRDSHSPTLGCERRCNRHRAVAARTALLRVVADDDLVDPARQLEELREVGGAESSRARGHARDAELLGADAVGEPLGDQQLLGPSSRVLVEERVVPDRVGDVRKGGRSPRQLLVLRLLPRLVGRLVGLPGGQVADRAPRPVDEDQPSDEQIDDAPIVELLEEARHQRKRWVHRELGREVPPQVAVRPAELEPVDGRVIEAVVPVEPPLSSRWVEGAVVVRDRSRQDAADRSLLIEPLDGPGMGLGVDVRCPDAGPPGEREDGILEPESVSLHHVLEDVAPEVSPTRVVLPPSGLPPDDERWSALFTERRQALRTGTGTSKLGVGPDELLDVSRVSDVLHEPAEVDAGLFRGHGAHDPAPASSRASRARRHSSSTPKKPVRFWWISRASSRVSVRRVCGWKTSTV